MSHFLLVLVLVALVSWVWVLFARDARGRRRGPRTIVVHDHTNCLAAEPDDDDDDDDDDEPTDVDRITVMIATSYFDAVDDGAIEIEASDD